MISSRKLEDLLPEVRVKCQAFIDACHAEGIDILITSTYRDNESQDALYAQGRKTAGNIVTNAKGGHSYHNYKCAFDFVPMVNGKCAWGDDKLITHCGKLAKNCGLDWAGDWVTFKEKLHCQDTDNLTIQELFMGKKPFQSK